MLARLRETQKGDTANAAIGDLTRLSRNYQNIHTECGLIRLRHRNSRSAWLDGDGGSVVKPQTPTNPDFAAKIVATDGSRGHSGYWDNGTETPQQPGPDHHGPIQRSDIGMSRMAAAEHHAGRATARVGAVTASALLLATGCTTMSNDGSGGLDYEPQRMSVSDAEDLTRRQSSTIFDASGLREANNGAPAADPCQVVANGFRIRHFWSMYGPSADSLKQAMDRLHKELPAKGWKVYRFEPAKSEAKQLQLDIEHEKDHHTVQIELLLPSTYKGASKWEKEARDSPVSLASPCYVDPEYKLGD